MSIIFQDPHSATPRLLIEELGTYFRTADTIYCAFAFVTARGIDLLFGQEDVQKNLKHAKVQLLVGMDAITDTKALSKLAALCSDYPGFSAKIFLPSSGGIFHPKVSWVRNGETGVVIIGSGNLTTGGLKNNFEAFSVTEIDKPTADALETSWNTFLDHNPDYLFDLDSDEAKEAAEQNRQVKKAIKKIRKKAGKKSGSGPVFPESTSVVFIQDLTKGRGGKQRDVGLWPGEHYFGENQQLYITHVTSDGQREAEEIRTVSKKEVSRNAAIDLAASKGIEPIEDRKPISVFIRTKPNNFFYHIIPPDSPDYDVVSTYLSSEAVGVPAGKARRIPDKKRPAAISVKTLRDIWPNAPFWKLEADDETE